MIELAGLDLRAFLDECGWPPEPPAATPKRGRGRPRKDGGGPLTDDRKIELAMKYVATCGPAVPGMAPAGAHTYTYGVICQVMEGFDLTIEQTRQAVADWNARCEPPWSDVELDHKLNEAHVKTANSPDRGSKLSRKAEAKKAEPCRAPIKVPDHPLPLPPVAAVEAGRPAEDDPPKGGGKPLVVVPAPGLILRVPDQYKSKFMNFDEVDEAAYLSEKVDESRMAIVGDWPRRVDGSLFVWGENGEPEFLKDADQFFAWMQKFAWVRWKNKQDFMSQSQYFKYMLMTVRKYESLELLPHWPERPDTYYMHPPIVGAGGALETLLDFFNGYQDVDRGLIEAFILSLFVGTGPGTRPIFLFTAADDDTGKGRGVGKSTLISVLSRLVKGYIDVSAQDDIGDIKTRLLSDQGFFQRLVRIDNIKSLRFSWAGLESLTTSPLISGKRLYVGEGSRPNMTTWGLTLNGAAMSKDMADRVLVTMLNRPPRTPGWVRMVMDFMEQRMMDILVDIGRRLMAPTPPDFEPVTRWGEWEAAVLSKIDNYRDVQAAIIERQSSVDADSDDTDEIRDFFYAKIKESGNGDPDTGCFRISSSTASKWLSEVTGERYATARATGFIRGLAIPELKQFRMDNCRGWTWTGRNAPWNAEPYPGQIL